MGSASALGYLFVLILSRALGPGDFGAFSSLNSIGMVLAIPAGAFQVMFASRIARRGEKAFDLRLPLLLGTAGVLITAVLSPVLAHVARVESVWAPVVLGLGLLPLIVNGAMMGGLLGLRRVGALSMVYLFMGLSRVLAASVAHALGVGLTGSLALVVLASVLTTIFLWWLCRGQAHLPWSSVTASRVHVVRMLFRSNSSMGVLMALTSVDVVLARYVLSPVESGEYALVASLGRAPVWVTQFLALAMVPALARSGSPKSILRAGGVVLGVCAVGAGAAAAAPELWIGILGGAAYKNATGLLLPYLALGTLLALVQVLIVAEVAQGRHLLAKVAWCAAILEVVLCLGFFRDNAFQVLGTAVVATGLVVVFGLAELFLGKGRTDTTKDDAAALLTSPQ